MRCWRPWSSKNCYREFPYRGPGGGAPPTSIESGGQRCYRLISTTAQSARPSPFVDKDFAMPRSLVFAATAVLLLASLAPAATITLKPDGTGDFPTIQDACDGASPGDVIVLEPGTYTDSNTRFVTDWNGDPTLTTAIAFLSPGLTITSSGGADVTILDGEESHHGFVGDGLGDITIAGISFVDCRPTGGGGLLAIAGAGIGIVNSTPSIIQCVFRHCEALGGGGAAGLYLIECPSASVLSNLFHENVAGDIGGGVGILDCQNTAVVGNTFHANVAFDGGGAIEVNFSSITFDNNILSSNLAANTAGGLLCLNGSVVTGGCNLFWDNQAPADEHVTPGCLDLTASGNLIADPQFCNVPFSDFTVRSNSPAADTHPSGCGQRGAFGVGCGPVSIETESWGSIKAHYR